MTSFVNPGDSVGGRYQLRTLYATHGRTSSWVGVDQQLSRAVLIHAIPPDQPNTLEILDTARAAASTTDSRFLRVLDAILAEEPPYGSFVVCEHVDATLLSTRLAAGSLGETASCWLARELADGLSSMHAQGISHGQLHPDTVHITESGHIKAACFVLSTALALGRTTPSTHEDDLIALGEIFCACLAGAWPAWTGDLEGISPAVSDMAVRLTEGNAYTTAAEVASAFDQLLSGSDASSTLARTLVDPTQAEPTVPVLPVAKPQGHRPFGLPLDDEPTMSIRPISPASPPSTDDDFTPVPRPTHRAKTGAPLLKILSIVFAVSLVVGLIGVAVRSGGSSNTPKDIPAVAIASIRDFDPAADGGDAKENSELVNAAIDSDPATAWRTEKYGKSSNLNGFKPGVGLVLELKSEHELKKVIVTLTGTTDIEVRVPAKPSGAAPLESISYWTTVASAQGASGTTELALTAPTRSRFVLIYLTKVPPVPGEKGFQGVVNEVIIPA